MSQKNKNNRRCLRISEHRWGATERVLSGGAKAGVLRDELCKKLGGRVNLAPTILELFGVTPPKQMDRHVLKVRAR